MLPFNWDQTASLQFHGFGQSRSRLTVVSFTVSEAVVLGPMSIVTHTLNLNIISAKTVESLRGQRGALVVFSFPGHLSQKVLEGLVLST